MDIPSKVGMILWRMMLNSVSRNSLAVLETSGPWVARLLPLKWPFDSYTSCSDTPRKPCSVGTLYIFFPRIVIVQYIAINQCTFI